MMRAYEFILTEARYDSMVTAMIKNFPEHQQTIENAKTQASAILKKSDRIEWWLNIVKAYLSDITNQTNSLQPLLGTYNFQSLDQLWIEFSHFFGEQNNNKIQNYQFKKQLVSEVMTAFKTYEDEYNRKQAETAAANAPVELQPGDIVLHDFGNDSAWYLLDRAYCQEEGRSGKHCGNVTGQQQTDQRILSYRVKGHVHLTFILEPDGFLGEMKAKNNQKPREEYHPYIMWLLMQPNITGIKGAGWGPEFNFSVFDLDDKHLKIIINQKPILIKTQIESTPMEFLKAPPVIRNNPEYQQVAVQELPAIKPLLSGDSSENWEEAIRSDKSLIIHAPDTLKNFRVRLISVLAGNPKLILQAPRSISRDPEILKAVAYNSPGAMRFIVPTTKGYFDIAKSAISTGLYYGQQFQNMRGFYEVDKDKYFQLLKLSIDRDVGTITEVDWMLDSDAEMYISALNDAISKGVHVFNQIPKKFKDTHPTEFIKLAKLAALSYGSIIVNKDVLGLMETHPKDFVEIFLNALSANSHVVRVIVEISKLHEIYPEGYVKIIKAAIKQIPSALDYVPSELQDKMKAALNKTESLDLTRLKQLGGIL